MSYSESKKRVLGLRKRCIGGNIPIEFLNLADYYTNKAIYCREERTKKQSGYDEGYRYSIRFLEQANDILMAYLRPDWYSRPHKWLDEELGE